MTQSLQRLPPPTSWILLGAVLLSACRLAEPDLELWIPYRDFKTFAAPREGITPGTVIKIDENGSWSTVGALPEDRAAEPQELVFARMEFKRRSSLEALSQYFGGVVAQADAGKKSQLALSIAITGAKLHSIHEDVNIQKLLLEIGREMDLEVAAGDRFELITETVSAKALRYELHESSLNRAGVTVDDASQVFPEAKLKWSEEASRLLSLSTTFRGPRQIMYDTVPVSRSALGLEGETRDVPRLADVRREVAREREACQRLIERIDVQLEEGAAALPASVHDFSVRVDAFAEVAGRLLAFERITRDEEAQARLDLGSFDSTWESYVQALGRMAAKLESPPVVVRGAAPQVVTVVATLAGQSGDTALAFWPLTLVVLPRGESRHDPVTNAEPSSGFGLPVQRRAACTTDGGGRARLVLAAEPGEPEGRRTVEIVPTMLVLHETGSHELPGRCRELANAMRTTLPLTVVWNEAEYERLVASGAEDLAATPPRFESAVRCLKAASAHAFDRASERERAEDLGRRAQQEWDRARYGELFAASQALLAENPPRYDLALKILERAMSYASEDSRSECVRLIADTQLTWNSLRYARLLKAADAAVANEPPLYEQAVEDLEKALGLVARGSAEWRHCDRLLREHRLSSKVTQAERLEEAGDNTAAAQAFGRAAGAARDPVVRSALRQRGVLCAGRACKEAAASEDRQAKEHTLDVVRALDWQTPELTLLLQSLDCLRCRRSGKCGACHDSSRPGWVRVACARTGCKRGLRKIRCEARGCRNGEVECAECRGKGELSFPCRECNSSGYDPYGHLCRSCARPTRRFFQGGGIPRGSYKTVWIPSGHVVRDCSRCDRGHVPCRSCDRGIQEVPCDCDAGRRWDDCETCELGQCPTCDGKGHRI